MPPVKQVQPYFQRQTLQLARQTFALGGTVLSFQASRDSIIKGFNIVVEGTIGTAAATASVEGLAALVQNVSIRGSHKTESNVNPINNLSGPDLFELYQFQNASLPRVSGSLSSTGAFRLNIPVYFDNPRMPAPFNLATCLPAQNMTDLTIEIRTALQAQVDTNAVPTFALTSASCYVVQDQYMVETIDPDWKWTRNSLDVLDVPVLTTGSLDINLPTGGYYSLILMRAAATKNSAGVILTKQSDTTAYASSAPFNLDVGGGMKLYDVNKRVKLETDYLSIRADNLASTLDSLVDGNACIQFNQSPNQLYWTGQPTRGTNNLVLTTQVRTGTNASVRTVYQRIFA